MVPSGGVTAFARACVNALLKDEIAQPALLLVDDSPPAPSGGSALWHLQNRFFPPDSIAMHQMEPLDRYFAGVPARICRGQIGPEDIHAVRSANIDFILQFAFGDLNGDILTCAPYGVWAFRHGDAARYGGGPAAFWEIYTGDRVTAAVLERLTANGPVVLKRSYLPTARVSHRKNLQRIKACSAHMARWVCVDILHRRAGYLNDRPDATPAPLVKTPTNLQMLRFWSRIALNWVLYKLENQRIDDWNVGVIEQPPSRWLDPAYVPAIEWTEYRERGQAVADPFLLPGDSEIRILAEELHWFNEAGRIAEIRRGTDGRLSEITTALDIGVHMSYPYTFEHAGTVYCIPETAQVNEVRLYRLCADGTWDFVTTLLKNVPALDSTVLFANGKWWLLHSANGEPDEWSLYIWSAPDLTGPWMPHPANPVKTDVASTRPAGTPFWHEGQLYRPAQDGRNCYGGGLAINRVDVLSMDNFCETTVRYISPEICGRYRDGIHTLSSFGNRSIIDAKKHVWPPAFLISRFLSKRLRKRATKPFSYRNMSAAPVARERPSAVIPHSR